MDDDTRGAGANLDASFGVKPWLAFAAAGSIWGSTFLVIRIGNDALAPVWAATLRLALAALLLAGLTFARGAALPRGAALRAALRYGVCVFGINFPLLYWGEKVVPSGLSAVLYATIPLSSALLTRAFGMERLTLPKLAGAAIAMAGVVVLFSSTLRGHVGLSGLLAIFIAATVASLGNVMLKRGPRQDPVAANAVGSAIGALLAGAVSFALGEPHLMPATPATLLPLLYLTVAGSMGAFVIMSWLVNHWPVTRASYVSVVVPVLALGLGHLVRGEQLPLLNLAGALLVLFGLLVGMRPAAPARPRLSQGLPSPRPDPAANRGRG
ncbi:MAG TPA: EamA family transporter [Polyangia bacterium]|nr:EamA family transporter [Polyangia bacterium]